MSRPLGISDGQNQSERSNIGVTSMLYSALVNVKAQLNATLNFHTVILTQLCVRKQNYAVFSLRRLPCPVYTLTCALAQLLLLESVLHMQSAPPTHFSPNNSGII